MEKLDNFLTTVAIKKYRSIKDVTIIDIPQILGLWGDNGSGKSNLLQAIYLFSRTKLGLNLVSDCLQQFHIRQLSDVFNKHIPGKEPLEFISINRGGSQTSIHLIKQNQFKLCEGPNLIETFYLPPWRHILDKYSDLSKGTNLNSIKFVSDGNTIQNFIEDQISRLTSLAASGDEKAIELYQFINDWAISSGLGRITSRLESHLTTSVYFDPIDGEMDVPDAGFGGRTILPIIALTTLTENKLFLIEEPEISLHPAAQADMAERLIHIAKRQNHQIIFTSHSDYLLKRFTRMIKDEKVDDEIFRAMHCEKNENDGSVYNYVNPEELLSNFEKRQPLIPGIHKRK